MSEPSLDLLDAYAERCSNWGRWGPDDQVGTANLITPRHVRDAARLVDRGQVVSLSLPYDQNGPQSGANGRFNCLRYSTSTGSDHAAGIQEWGGAPFPHDIGFADDTVILHLHSGTHWDSLAHVFHRGRMYNGFSADEVSADGARRNGSERLRDRLVGRGVLLDLPRVAGIDWLQDGHAIGADELEAAAEATNVEIREGDILLLRTGKMARCLRHGWGRYAGGDAPGLSLLTIPWLHARGIAAVAADTWGVEVRPNEVAGAYQPFHIPAIVYMGLLLGEMFFLEDLADACAADGVYECFVSAPPVQFTGTAGAPPGPVAVR